MEKRPPRRPMFRASVPLGTFAHMELRTDPANLEWLREHWHPSLVEPIFVGVDQDGKLRILNGHHRLALARERNDETIRIVMHTRDEKSWMETAVDVPLIDLEHVVTITDAAHAARMNTPARWPELPPIKLLIGDDGRYRLSDGNHTLRLARERGEVSIRAIVAPHPFKD